LRDLCRVAGGDFPRLRVGVRGDSVSDDLAAWVTSPFSVDELDAVERAVGRAADAIEAAITEGINTAMNRFNQVEARGPEG
jgi:PTH1 family peptidyl-tRNA hydrolase